MVAEINPIELSKLELKPGDTLVLKTDLRLNKEQRDRLYEMAEQMVPKGVKIAVLAWGLSYEVQKPD